MGWRDWFKRRPRGREMWIRPDYQDLPQHEWTDDEYDHWFAHLPEDEAWQQWDRWSRETHPHPNGIAKIKRGCLRICRESARDGDTPGAPLEFACLLRVEGDTITEPVLIAGTVQGDEHAIFDFWNQPLDRDVRGSLHSHPDEHPYPSDADFELFAAHGEVHIILCRPYGPDDWRAYDFRGIPVSLEVVD